MGKMADAEDDTKGQNKLLPLYETTAPLLILTGRVVWGSRLVGGRLLSVPVTDSNKDNANREAIFSFPFGCTLSIASLTTIDFLTSSFSSVIS